MLSHLEPLVIHNTSDFSETRFSGYAFSGHDLIISAQGHADWVGSKQSTLGFHQDGCYILGRPADGGYRIGGDYKGYCKLYTYKSAERWAVSNSFSTLVEFAHSKSWTVTPNEHIFYSHSLPGAFWQQHTTFETSVQEITLLPRTYLIDVTADRELITRPNPEPSDAALTDDYSEALSNFQKLWVGRLGTTIRHTENALSAEITGGLDSRVVLSLLLSLRQHFPTHFSRQLFMKSNPSQDDDIRVATRLCNVYRLNLNKTPPRATLGVELYDPVARWWDVSLGAYTPIYFAPRSSTAGHFTVGGHGGEGHRSYWQIDSPHQKLEELEKQHPSAPGRHAMREAFDSAKELLDAGYPGVPRTVAHYREFRDRIHSGLHAQNTVRLQPLSSNTSYMATTLLSTDALERGQFLYDIIGNSAPGLLRQPFDKAAKEPSETILRELSYADPIYPLRGEIYGATKRNSPRPPSSLPPWSRLEDLFGTALHSAQEMPLPPKTIENAQEAWRSIKADGKLSHPKHSVGIQHVILAGLIAGSITRPSL